jgi:hypothetical protein
MSGDNGKEFDYTAKPAVAAAESPAESIDAVVNIEEFSPSQVANAANKAKQEARSKNANILKKAEELKRRKLAMEQETPTTKTVHEEMDEEFRSIAEQVKSVLAEEVAIEEGRLLQEIEDKETRLNERKGIRKVWKYVVEFFGSSVEIKLPRQVDKEKVLDTVIQNYMTVSRAKISLMDKQRAGIAAKKDAKMAKVDEYTALQFEHLDVYEEAEAKINSINTELQRLDQEKRGLLKQRAAPDYNHEVDNTWTTTITNIESNEQEREKFKKAKQGIKKDMQDIHRKLVSSRRRTQMYQKAEEDISNTISNLHSVYDMLRDYKEDKQDRTSIMNIYQEIADSGELVGKIGQMNDIYERGLANIMNSIKRNITPPGGSMNPDLIGAIQDSEESENETGNDIIEAYRALRNR